MKIDLKKHQQRKERQYQEQIIFLMLLAMAMTMRQNKISAERMIKILDETQQQVSELTAYLTANTCIYKDGQQNYDVEYNLETLRRLAEEYHIKFNEEIFRT